MRSCFLSGEGQGVGDGLHAVLSRLQEERVADEGFLLVVAQTTGTYVLLGIRH